MSDDEFLKRWHLIDDNALSSIQQYATSAGIYQLATTALPEQLQKLPGAANYFVSSYPAPIPIGSNTVAGGELAVMRKDKELWKTYNYIFASSGDGRVYFNGPYKNFPEHHLSSTSQVSLESLFGHTPNSTKGSL
jgi:hypothetical protein